MTRSVIAIRLSTALTAALALVLLYVNLSPEGSNVGQRDEPSTNVITAFVRSGAPFQQEKAAEVGPERGAQVGEPQAESGQGTDFNPADGVVKWNASRSNSSVWSLLNSTLSSLVDSDRDPGEATPQGISGEMSLKLIFGVLSSPDLFEKRLVPLLQTSLRSEDVMVFFERNDSDWVQASIREMTLKIARMKRPKPAVLFPLDPLPDMRMSLRNAWTNLPVLAALIAHRPHADWFVIVDDDTYTFTTTARAIVHSYTPLAHTPIYLGDKLSWGRGGGIRAKKRNGRWICSPTTKRQPVDFVCGGSGIYLNRKAALTVAPHLENCSRTFFHGAGDIRLGACMQSIGMNITVRREFVKDMWFRAIGELHLDESPNFYPIPASFHRLRTPKHFHLLHAVEVSVNDPIAARQSNTSESNHLTKVEEWSRKVKLSPTSQTLLRRMDLVQWGDIRKAFPMGQGDYYESLYYPKRFDNFSKVYGHQREPMTRERLRQLERVCGKLNFHFGDPNAGAW